MKPPAKQRGAEPQYFAAAQVRFRCTPAMSRCAVQRYNFDVQVMQYRQALRECENGVDTARHAKKSYCLKRNLKRSAPEPAISTLAGATADTEAAGLTEVADHHAHASLPA